MNRKIEIVDNLQKINNKSIIIQIDGKNIKTDKDLYKEFKKKILFPDYFGNNWNAFWDIIIDEDFIKEDIVLYISNFSSMFNNYEDKNIFSRILLDWLQSNFIKINILIYILKEK